MDSVKNLYINCLLSQPIWQCSCDLVCGDTSNLFQIRSNCDIKMRCCPYFPAIFVIGECDYREWISWKTSFNSITVCDFKFYYNGSVVQMLSPSPKHRSHTRVLFSIMGMDARFYSDSTKLKVLKNHLLCSVPKGFNVDTTAIPIEKVERYSHAPRVRWIEANTAIPERLLWIVRWKCRGHCQCVPETQRP